MFQICVPNKKGQGKKLAWQSWNFFEGDVPSATTQGFLHPEIII